MRNCRISQLAPKAWLKIGGIQAKSLKGCVCSVPQLQVSQNDPREKWPIAPFNKKPATTKAWPFPYTATTILLLMVKSGFKIHCVTKIAWNSKHGKNKRKMKLPSFWSSVRLSYSISLSQNVYKIARPQEAFETNTPLLHTCMKKSSAPSRFLLLQLYLIFFSFGERGNSQINAVSLWADLTTLLYISLSWRLNNTRW